MAKIFVVLCALVTVCTSQRAQQLQNGGRPTSKPNIIFGGFSPIVEPNPGGKGRRQEPRKPIRFPTDENVRRGNFIPEPSRNVPRSQITNRKTTPPPRVTISKTTPPPRFGPSSFSSTPETGFRAPPTSFNYDYNYDYDYDYDEPPLPSGPTREPPLPSGPTRRPGQPTTQPPLPAAGVPREVFNRLPLLTTKRPITVTPRPNVNFRLSPPKNRGQEPNFELPRRGPGGGLLVTSDLDILDQTKLFTNMDPNQEQFIKAPIRNAGALPLAFESTLPVGRFPPLNNP